MEQATIKILAMTNDLIIISQIEELGVGIGEPDCKLIKPFVVRNDETMVSFLCGYTKQNVFKISSDKILTIANPSEQLLKKYNSMIKDSETVGE